MKIFKTTSHRAVALSRTILTSMTNILLLLVIFFMSSSALCADKVLKKQATVPTRWYGSTDISYSNWVRNKLEGGGESQAAGLQLGLNLPWNSSVYIRASAMPQPVGILDTRFGLSTSFAYNDRLRNSLAASFSSPSSAYSRSIYQKTQASLASTLEFSQGAFTAAFSAYGTKAYYSQPPDVLYQEEFYLNKKNKNRGKTKVKPASAATPLVTPANPTEENFADQTFDVNFGDIVYLTRFDRMWGTAIDFGYRFSSGWSINSNGSVNHSAFSSEASVWSTDVTVIQLAYSRYSLTIYGGGRTPG